LNSGSAGLRLAKGLYLRPRKIVRYEQMLPAWGLLEILEDEG
jgi:hypothetical protein